LAFFVLTKIWTTVRAILVFCFSMFLTFFNAKGCFHKKPEGWQSPLPPSLTHFQIKYWIFEIVNPSFFPAVILYYPWRRKNDPIILSVCLSVNSPFLSFSILSSWAGSSLAFVCSKESWFFILLSLCVFLDAK
jgi:hypothetical protein